MELLPASASNGRSSARSGRVNSIHMPRNARFDCAAKIEEEEDEEEEVSEEKGPATSKTMPPPTGIK